MGDYKDKKNDGSAEVIEEAYAAILEPERLETFEAFWESYINSTLQGNHTRPLSLKDTPVHMHLTRALEIVERMRHTHLADDKLQAVVRLHNGVAFVINSFGVLQVQNTAAEALINGCKTLNDMAIDSKSKAQIDQWMNRRNTLDQKEFLFVYALTDDAMQKRICLMLAPITVPRNSHGQRESYFLVTTVNFAIAPGALNAIRMAFGLSAAEGEVVMKLMDGLSPQDIALGRQVSVLTVRTQIKYAVDKTGAKNQADMIRILGAMAGQYVNVESHLSDAEAKLSKNAMVRYGSITLRDGRYLEYLEQGHPNGRAVLHIHSLMNGPKQSDEFARNLVMRGWRVISPSRPGYGNSEVNVKTDIRELVNSTSKDIHELVRHLGLQDLIVIGTIYGQNYVANYPDYVRGFLCVNKVPLWDIEDLQYFQPRQRRFIKTSIYTPQIAKFPARLAKILVDTGREALFIHGLNKNSPADIEAVKDPVVFEVVAEGFRHALKQGVDAFTTDVVAHHTDWSEDARKLTHPVTLLSGSENTMNPQILFERYSKILPQLNIRLVNGAGIYLPITHPEIITEECEKLWDRSRLNCE